MKKLAIFFLCFLTFVNPALITDANSVIASDIKLPDDIVIKTPDQTVPKELAAFSGKWAGSWDKVLNHILIVEEVRQTDALVVYATGEAPVWNIHESQWRRVKGEFINGKLVIKFPRRQVTVTYSMKNGELDGIYEGPRIYSKIKMSPVKE